MNLLKDPIIKSKIEELLGKTPNDIYLDIVWGRLTTVFGYELDLQDREEEKLGTDIPVLYLNYRPVRELIKISINKTEEVLDEFEIYKERAIKYIGGCFRASGFDNCVNSLVVGYDALVKAEYSAGYTVDDFPHDLLYACVLMYRNLEFNNSSKGNLKGYKISDISYTFKENNDDEITDILTGYLL